jgi:hypothetical protein
LSGKRLKKAQAKISKFCDIDLDWMSDVGNDTKMYLVRANDGTNDANYQRENARRAIEIVNDLLREEQDEEWERQNA